MTIFPAYGQQISGLNSPAAADAETFRLPSNSPDIDYMRLWPSLRMCMDADDPYVVKLFQQYATANKLIFPDSRNPDSITYQFTQGMTLLEDDPLFDGHNSFQISENIDLFSSAGIATDSYTIALLMQMHSSRYNPTASQDSYFACEYDPAVNSNRLTLRYEHTTPEIIVSPKAGSSFPGTSAGTALYTGSIPAAGVVGLWVVTFDKPTLTSKLYIDDMTSPVKTQVHTGSGNTLTTTRMQLFNVVGSSVQGFKGGCSLFLKFDEVVSDTIRGQIKTVTDFRR